MVRVLVPVDVQGERDSDSIVQVEGAVVDGIMGQDGPKMPESVMDVTSDEVSAMNL